MRDVVILDWNLPNWITVMLMALLGYLLLATIAQLVQTMPGGGGWGGGFKGFNLFGRPLGSA